jgi:DNA-binding transcriptional regulator YhcF (GntR family)
MGSKRRRSASAVEGGTGVVFTGAEVLSFLKENRGAPSWSVQDLAKALRITAAVAKRAITLLEAQGYVQPSRRGVWLTTASGDSVSGSKPPRFTPESAAAALSGLAERIRALNQDREAPFEVGIRRYEEWMSSRTHRKLVYVGSPFSRAGMRLAYLLDGVLK